MQYAEWSDSSAKDGLGERPGTGQTVLLGEDGRPWLRMKRSTARVLARKQTQ